MTKLKVAYIMNIIIFMCSVLATIMMFTGFKFMGSEDLVLEESKIGMLKFFTVDSNIFMGVISLIFAIFEKRKINGKISDISTKLYTLKFMATVSVTLTFVVVFAYLGPISKGGIVSMLKNSNLFFHFIIPVLSVIVFSFLEKSNKLDFKSSLYGIIPTSLYGVFYLINVLIHMQNGQVDFKYDWYWFVQQGVWTAVIVIPAILMISYLISFTLWKLHSKDSNLAK